MGCQCSTSDLLATFAWIRNRGMCVPEHLFVYNRKNFLTSVFNSSTPKISPKFPSMKVQEKNLMFWGSVRSGGSTGDSLKTGASSPPSLCPQHQAPLGQRVGPWEVSVQWINTWTDEIIQPICWPYHLLECSERNSGWVWLIRLPLELI